MFCSQKRCYFLFGAVVLLGAVFAYLGFAKPPFPRVYFAETNVTCLPNNGQRVEVALNMHLKIRVDDVDEVVPANIGNTMKCTTELHTHKNDGTVSVELYDADRIKKLSFADFFAVWGVPVLREGYTLTILSNGSPVASLSDIPLRDGGEVVLSYTSVPKVDTE